MNSAVVVQLLGLVCQNRSEDSLEPSEQPTPQSNISPAPVGRRVIQRV